MPSGPTSRPILLDVREDEFPEPRRESGSSFTDEHHVALAWVFDARGVEILLVNHPVVGWSCPGGHLEPAETLVAAAERELFEETGLVLAAVGKQPLTLGRLIGCPRSPGADTVHWTAGFEFIGDPAVQLRPEPGRPTQWFRLDAIPDDHAPDIDAVLACLRARSSGLQS